MSDAHSNKNQQKKKPGKRKPTPASWKPGQSGNPSGRRKDVGHVQLLAREHTESALATLVEVMQNPAELGAARVRAAEAVLDRGWGRPHAAVEVTGAHGGPIQFEEARDELSSIIAGIAARGREDSLVKEPH